MDSSSILFNHPCVQQRDPFSQNILGGFSRKKDPDPWKEVQTWKRYNPWVQNGHGKATLRGVLHSTPFTTPSMPPSLPGSLRLLAQSYDGLAALRARESGAPQRDVFCFPLFFCFGFSPGEQGS